MSVKNLVNDLRKALEAEGIRMPMAHGRDKIARLFYDKSYSACIAAERAGKLLPPQIIDSCLTDLRAKYGVQKTEVIELLSRAFLEDAPNQLSQGEIMIASQEIGAGRLVPPPTLTAAVVGQHMQRQARRGMEVEVITLNAYNFHQGPHLNFVRTGGQWYAMFDHVKSGAAAITAQFEGAILRQRERNDPEGSHHFLMHEHDGQQWTLHFVEHTMVDEDEFDCTAAELDDDSDEY